MNRKDRCGARAFATLLVAHTQPDAGERSRPAGQVDPPGDGGALDFDALVREGDKQVQLKHWEEALRFFKRAEAIDHTSPSLLYKIGCVYGRLGNKAEAKRYKDISGYVLPDGGLNRPGPAVGDFPYGTEP